VQQDGIAFDHSDLVEPGPRDFFGSAADPMARGVHVPQIPIPWIDQLADRGVAQLSRDDQRAHFVGGGGFGIGVIGRPKPQRGAAQNALQRAFRARDFDNGVLPADRREIGMTEGVIADFVAFVPFPLDKLRKALRVIRRR
jgi:hypothetical protein